MVATLSGCSQLPSCSSSETKKLIGEIINQRSFSLGEFVSVSDISKIAFNKDSEIRVCEANLTTTKTTEDITYSIKWGNEDKSQFEVRIQ